jgi:hypothetical protein
MINKYLQVLVLLYNITIIYNMSDVLIGPKPAALSGNTAMYQSKINGGYNKIKSKRNKRNKSRRNKSIRRRRS